MTPGEIVDGRFRIERLAGSGGMGQVYAALDRVTGARVALKILHSHSQARALAAAALTAEAELLAELRHPGIVAHVAHGYTAEGAPYLAMEWLDGEDLAARLARAPLGVGEAVLLGRRVAEALAAAHARGVVHRDVKPANLILVGGRVEQTKILDFGVARSRRGVGPSGGPSAGLVGTLAYMAPEQARGDERLDARADVFALGAVLFECLTGRAAFAAAHPMAVLARILLEEPPRVRERVADVPEALDALVAEMLSKDPEGRPRDGAAVAAVLAALADATTAPARVSAPPPSLTAGEQRLLCVVMSAPPAEPDAATAPTLAVADDGEEVERLRRVVARFGGRMEQLAGGAVVVVLSGTSAATDLAARAARCALAMRAEAPELPLALATGRGILAERWPVGEAIDRAVKLLGRAPWPGFALPVRVDDVTAGLLPARFDVGGDADGLDLRGERDAAPAARTLLGKATPCVGREREVAQLAGLLDECVTRRRSRAVVVTAEAGVGKSRLMSELLQRVGRRAEPVAVWIARGDPMTAGAPFGLLGQAIRGAAGVVDGEAAGARFRKLRGRVQRHVTGADADRMAAFLGEIAGVPATPGPGSGPEPERARFDSHDAAEAQLDAQLDAARRDPMLLGDQMARAWEDLLFVEAGAGPLLIVLDDLHWGDLPSVKLVDAALRNVPDRPWMALAFGRPEVHEIFPRLWAGRPVSEVRLAHLGEDAGAALVRNALGAAATDETTRRLVEQAAGNAFYLEELIRAAAAGGGDELPATVLAMAAARIEGLDPEARRVLRAGSVFGQVFSRAGAEALLPGAFGADRLGAVLADLVAREVLALRGPLHTFRHALLREAAYATLTDADRTLGHRLAGAWLERAGGGEPMALAEHFERGGAPDRAIGWYRRAAEQALGGNDLVAAIARADRAAACGASGEALGAVRAIQTEALSWRLEMDEAIRRGREALDLLPHGGAAWCGVAGDVATALWKRSRTDQLDAFIGQVLVLGEGGREEEHHLSLWGRIIAQLFVAGRRAAAQALFDRLEAGLGASAPALRPVTWAQIHHARSWAALFRGDPAGSVRWEEAAVAAFEQAGALRNAAMMRSGLGVAYREIGALAEAEGALREAFAEAVRLGLEGVRAGALHNLGLALAFRGALAEARAVETEALGMMVASGDRRLASAARYYLGRILQMMGELDEAERMTRAALDDTGGAAEVEIIARGVLASIELDAGRSAEALAHAGAARERLDVAGDLEEGQAFVLLTHAAALRAEGQVEAAREAIAAAQAYVQARAAKIADPAWRAGFLALPDHARILECARAF